MTWRIDDYDAVSFCGVIDQIDKGMGGYHFIVGSRMTGQFIQAKVIRNFEVPTDMLSPSAPILDVAREASLPGVEIDRRYLLT
jgi:hypothetical protein